LQEAIQQALTILSWFENSSEEDCPPEYIWEDDEGLDQWWKEVKARRGDGSYTDSDVDDMESNELAAAFKDI
jgi:hypothetical protein